jgi:hypothetical protein
MGKHRTGHNYLALYACLQAGENSSWRGAEGLPEEHRKASCSFFPRPLHGRGRHSDRPWATTKHPATAWSTATRRCRFTRRLARLIAVIGDLPAISVIVSDSSADYPLQVKIWLNGIRSRRLHVGVQLSPVVGTCPSTWLGPSVNSRTRGTDRDGGSRTAVRR